MKFIYGTEPYRIDMAIKKEKKNHVGEIVEFNSNSSIDDIIENIVNMSMFSSNKLIIISEHEVFTNLELATQLLEYVKNNYDGVEYVFSITTETPNKRNALVKYLLTNADIEVVEKLNPRNIMSSIKDLFKERGGSITNSGAMLLNAKLPNDLRIIINEIDKLLLYKNEIGEEEVEAIASQYTNDDFFELSNSILSKDPKRIISAFKSRLKLGDDEIFIIAQISFVLENAIICDSYSKQGYTNSEMSEETRIHAFKIKKGQELIRNFGEETVKELLISLANLDRDIKSGKIDKEIGLSTYFLNLIR